MSPVTEHIEEVSEDLFFVCGGPATKRLRTQSDLLASVNVPVLILGESGSGKEIAARLIHKLSPRSKSRFLKVNCAALSPDALEIELFGCDRISSAGTIQSRPGRFELCHGGTILLDSITEMPAALQAKLLHVLQDSQIFRLGADSAITVDVRILAASNSGVEKALSEKRLREDLYYRLSAFTLQVPPLRDRKEEIPAMLAHFIDRLAKYYGLKPRPISAPLLEVCQKYSWPGNLRELENVAKRYLVMGEEFLQMGELGGNAAKSDTAEEESTSENDIPTEAARLKSLLRNVKGEAERTAIASTLEKTHWNRRAAARELGISYRGLLYKIQEYQLSPGNSHLPTLLNNGVWKRN